MLDRALLDRKVIATGGKGGVGKTTIAAALALHCAEYEKLETLVMSSDPTPSLSDILEYQVGSQPTAIPGVSHLHALELSREEILKAWKVRFGDDIYDVVSSYVPVDKEIIDYVAEAPGLVDEQYMLAYLLDIVEEGGFDKIIWDTAPAGQTLGILKLESRFYDHLTQAVKLYIQFKSSFEVLKSKILRSKKRSPLDIINEWRELANHVLETLRDHSLIEFVLVTIPEGLGVAQTGRISTELANHGIQVNQLVINNVIPEDTANSPFLQSRKAMQIPYIEKLSEMFEGRTTKIPMLPVEVKGLKSIREISGYLIEKS